MSKSPLPWLGGLLVVYLAGPVVLFVVRFAGAPERGFHVAGLVPSLVISLVAATLTLALTCLFGIPLAYVLGRSKGALSRVIEVAVILPLALPPVIGGIIVVYLVGPYSFLGSHLGRQLTNSVYGIVIAMTFTSAPFLVLSARAAFSSIDAALLDVAATLGHSEFSRFIRVALPVIGPEIRAGMTMTWLRAFGEYGAVTILAYNPASLPIYTVNQFMARGITPTLAPTMLALVVAALVVLVSRARLPHRAHVELKNLIPEPPSLRRSARVRFHVERRLGGFHLDVAHVAATDNLAVLGPSGSGKSVLLRSLAGLEGPRVEVAFGDLDVSALRPEQRNVGYVAQGFSLFPHLTVWRNLTFPTNARPGTAVYWLRRLQLEGLENRYPHQLSGGQRQRVALAQALCHSPEVLLLDEPFSALDMPIRRELQRELRQLQRETGLATVIVTHDPEEAAFLAHEIVVLDEGHPIQAGTNRTLFTRPASGQVARLLGISNLHPATTATSGIVSAGGTHFDVDTQRFDAGSTVLWTVRPERIEVRPLGATPGPDPSYLELSGTLSDLADVGMRIDAYVRLDPSLELHARLDSVLNLAVDEPCVVRMRRDDLEVWPDGSRARTSGT